MRQLAFCWLGLSLWLGSQAGFAAVLPEFYTAVVPVEGRDTPARQAAFKQGLTNVLIKLSGNSEIPRSKAAQKAMGLASRYAIRHRYDMRATDKQLLQIMQFDTLAVNDLLKQLKLPLWAGERPTLLNWLVMLTPPETPEADTASNADANKTTPTISSATTDNAATTAPKTTTKPNGDAEISEADEEALIARLNRLHETQQPLDATATPSSSGGWEIPLEAEYVILNPEEHGDKAAVLHTLSQQRGVPMLMPLLDLQDRQLLTLQHLQQRDEMALKAVAERYATNAVLAGVLRKRDLPPPPEPTPALETSEMIAPPQANTTNATAATLTSTEQPPVPSIAVVPSMQSEQPSEPPPTEEWQAAWQLLYKEQLFIHRSQQFTFEALLDEGVDWAIHQIVTQVEQDLQAVETAMNTPDKIDKDVTTQLLNIVVTNVDSLDTFGRLRAQLLNLPIVTAVEIRQLEPQQVQLQLAIVATQHANAAQALANMPSLQSIAGQVGELTYRYAP